MLLDSGRFHEKGNWNDNHGLSLCRGWGYYGVAAIVLRSSSNCSRTCCFPRCPTAYSRAARPRRRRSSLSSASCKTAACSAPASSGGTTRPRPSTTSATWVPGCAVAITGRPLASMALSREGITRSAALARCGSRWMSAAFSRSLRRSSGCRGSRVTLGQWATRTSSRVRKARILAFLLLSVAPAIASDLTHATVVAPGDLSGPERKAVSLLIDSVRGRTRITWTLAAANPGAGHPVVRVRRAPPGSALPAEGYRLRSFDHGRAAGGGSTGNGRGRGLV